jgi:subtilase family serine protease
VTQISGLDTADQMRPLSVGPDASPPPATVTARPCSRFFGQKTAIGAAPAFGSKRPWAACGYTPRQLQGAYSTSRALRHGLTGRGQTVAIIDAYDSPTIAADANTYSHRHGLPAAHITRHASPLATNTPEVPGTFVDPQGWAGEETLDVEAVHAMAPRARIVYEGADTPLNVSLSMALNDVVDNARAQIVSNSYGSAGDFDNSSDDDPILEQAAAEGIGIYFSSGDEGDETKDPNGPGDREVDAPANDPLVTAVGGTSLGVTKRNRYGFETYWGTAKSTLGGGAWSPAPPGDYLYGGGGGTSQTYAEPSWQRGIVPGSIARYFAGKPPAADAGDANGDVHVPGRAVPDVSMVGDPNTGFREGITQDFSSAASGLPGLPTDDNRYGEYRIGGTSLSSPLFAGVMALADQASGRPHGFANPALYAAYRHRAYRDVAPTPRHRAVVRNDYDNGLDPSGGVTTSLRTFNVLNTLHLRHGYDDATGLGSPHGLDFLHALAPHSRLINRLRRH